MSNEIREQILALVDLVNQWYPNEPDVQLAAGATEEEISQLEEFLEETLPEELRGLLSVANGELPNGTALCVECKLLSTSGIVEAIKNLRDLQSDCGPLDEQNRAKNPYIRQDITLDDRWIPFADFLGYAYLMLDSNPARANTPIVFYWQYSGPSLSHVLGTGILDFLKRLNEYLSERELNFLSDLPPALPTAD